MNCAFPKKKLGTRKMYGLLKGFIQNHGITIGRDALFKLLRDKGMLIQKHYF